MQQQKTADNYWFDPLILGISLLLLCLGLIMVASASIAIAEKETGQAFYYFYRQLIATGLGLVAGLVIFLLPMQIWNKNAMLLLGVGMLLLVLVLIPGIGKVVNGSARWIPLGIFNLQVSEVVKLVFILYLAGYIYRKQQEIVSDYRRFIPPFVLLVVASALLLMEPDLGAVVVILTTALGMLFIAGVPMMAFMVLIVVFVLAVALLIAMEPYRLNRVRGFLDPWADPYDSGFQLTQSLMAVGRGEWIGVGLGNSIQKLLYLPEAHTDFIFAIIAEELGMIGAISIIVLFALLLFRIFSIALRAVEQQKVFQAFVLFGIGIWISFQAFVNIGVNMGVLPTKGLTLPLISYGGSSILVVCVAMALVLRAEYETRCHKGGPLSLAGKR